MAGVRHVTRPDRATIAALFAAAVVISCLAPAGSLAITPPMTLAQTAGQADLVVHGRVRKVESHWSKDRSSIYSDVSVEIYRLLANGPAAPSNKNIRRGAGAGGGELTFRVPGGEVDDVGMIDPHDPQPKVGEEVIVFLAAGGAADGTPAGVEGDSQTLSVVGSEQGWHPVQSGTVDIGGRRVAVGEFLSTVERSLRK